MAEPRISTYPYPISDVWAALTDPASLDHWLMNAPDFRAAAGHGFSGTLNEVPDWGETARGEVLTVEPEHRLAYRLTKDDGESITQTWTLESTPEGTRVSLDHDEEEHKRGLFDRLGMSKPWEPDALVEALGEFLARHSLPGFGGGDGAGGNGG